MSINRILILSAYSILGGILSAIAFAASIDNQLNIRTLMLPSVFSTTVIGGVCGGVLIAPLVIWAYRDKNIKLAIPTTYGLSIVVILLLNAFQVRFSMFIGYGFTILVILLYKSIGK